MEYLKVENGIITGHFCGGKLPENHIEVLTFEGMVDQPINWFNIPEGTKIPDEELITSGIRTDNKGVYYHKETREIMEIIDYDIDIPDGFTNQSIESFSFPIWDELSNVWKENLVDLFCNFHSAITAKRDEKIEKGFIYSDFTIQADAGSRAIAHQYLTKHLSGVDIFPLTWRTLDNKYLTLATIEEFTAFTDNMTNHINNRFTESWTTKDLIDAAQTVDEARTIFNNYMGV